MSPRRWCAADVLVRDAGAVRGLAAEQAAPRRPGRLPAGAGAQGNAGGPPARPQRPPGPPRPPALPRVAAAAPPQLSRRAALPQLLLTPNYSCTLPCPRDDFLSRNSSDCQSIANQLPLRRSFARCASI